MRALIPFSASRHSPPRRSHSHRHSTLPGRRSGRWYHLSGRSGRRNLKGSERARRAGCQLSDHNKRAEESFSHGGQQDQRDCCYDEGRKPEGNFEEAGGYGYE